MATFMMKSRRSSQVLLLLSFLLLAFSVIPAPIVRGESTIDGGRKGKIIVHEAAGVVIQDDDVFNGCWPHDAAASSVCCTKDKLCWPSLSECAINCPCKVRCNGL